MKSEYRAFWKNKMWEVIQIDYRTPQTLIITDGKIDHINVPIQDVVLMKNTGKTDISGEYIYEGDIIESHQGTQILDILMLVKYGTYEAYCPADDAFMDSVGFYVEAVGYPQMPVGSLSEYAKVIGNAYENLVVTDPKGKLQEYTPLFAKSLGYVEVNYCIIGQTGFGHSVFTKK